MCYCVDFLLADRLTLSIYDDGNLCAWLHPLTALVTTECKIKEKNVWKPQSHIWVFAHIPSGQLSRNTWYET